MSKIKNNLVSIITPSYNTEEFVSETIESVLAQDYENWEMIIVDDCSTDNSQVIISSYSNRDSRIKLFINEQNLGPAISRNRAIEISQGRFIAFLDSDDLWLTNKLSKQLKFMIDNDYPFSYSFYEQIDESGNLIKKIDKISKRTSYRSLLSENIVGCLTAVYDVEFFGKVYMENILKRQDFSLWLKLLKYVKYAYCLPMVNAKYRVRKGSVSSNKFDLIKYHWTIYRELERLSIVKCCYYLLYYKLKVIIKKLK